MKKLHENFYLPIFLVSGIFSLFLLGEKYGFYDSLPSYYLFKMPKHTYGGNILFDFFYWSFSIILFFLILFVISIFFKVKIELFKTILKWIKKNTFNIFYLILLIFVGPLFSITMDYSNLIIGIETSSGKLLPITFPALVVILLIGYFAYNLMYKK